MCVSLRPVILMELGEYLDLFSPGVFHLSHPFLVPLLLRQVYLFASLGHVGVENVRTTFPEQGKFAPFSWCQPRTFPWFLSPVSPGFSCPPFSTADEKLTLHSFFLEC